MANEDIIKDGTEPNYGYTQSFAIDSYNDRVNRSIGKGCRILVRSSNRLYVSVKDIGPGHIFRILISAGLVLPEQGKCDDPSYDGDIWSDYLYYANEAEDRWTVMAWNWKKMTLDKDIKCVSKNPHSADRAGTTDKLYVRTQNSNTMDVLDARRGIWLKKVELGFHPRSTGGRNWTKKVQVVTGKDHPKVGVIDTITDQLLYKHGDDAPENGVLVGNEVVGNQGGNATGHGMWLDTSHFCFPDRYSATIRVYNMAGDYDDGGYTFTHLSDLQLPTAVHVMQREGIIGYPDKHTFYTGLEGYEPWGIGPGVQEIHYRGNGVLELGRRIYLPYSDASDTVHHFGITSDNKYLYIPTYRSKLTHVIDLETFQIVKHYNSGLGGGHVNFCDSLRLAAVTNHFDCDVTILDMDSTQTWNVKISEEEPNIDGPLLQTHANWVFGEYFYIGASTDGIMYEIDLKNKRVNRRLYVGGRPEQSIS